HLQKQGKDEDALKSYEQAEKVLLGLFAHLRELKQPPNPAYLLELGRVEANRGALWTARQGKDPKAFEVARKAYEQSIRHLEPLAGRLPDAVYAKELGRAYVNLGVLLQGNRQPY